jgi:dihydrofolate reductase
MGRIVVLMQVSLDGFIERPDRDISWHRVDEELLGHLNAVIGEWAGQFYGRVLYEQMAAYWPTADEDPASPESTREFAPIYRAQRKIVYSRTLSSVAPGVELRREVDADEIRAIAAESERDLGIGGSVLVGEFLRQGLIDELRIYVAPLTIGAGTRLLPADVALDLDLMETRQFGNGVVLLRYDVLSPSRG